MRKRDPDWLRRWVENFNPLLDDQRRQTALNSLVAKGCDPTVIFESLAGCTHPASDDNIVTRRVKSNLRKRLRRLELLSRRIRRTQEALRDVKTEPLISHFRPISVELPSVLRVASDFLGRPALRKAFSLHKLPSGLALIALCLYVRRVTGAPSYTHLANLLEVGYQAHGATRIVLPKSLSRRVRRFKKAHPQIAEALKIEADGNLP
jgi:hypothetical protein